MATLAVPPSVHSTGTTASVPRGSIAPVMIRMLAPSGSAYAPVSPAATSATTGSVTGCCSEAVATSCTRTAYPSIEELSNDGSGPGAVTSCASTSPSASARLSSVGVSGLITLRISPRWVSTEVSASSAATGFTVSVMFCPLRSPPGRGPLAGSSEAVEVLAQPGHDLLGQVGSLAGELDHRAQVVELVAGVVAAAVE